MRLRPFAAALVLVLACLAAIQVMDNLAWQQSNPTAQGPGDYWGGGSGALIGGLAGFFVARLIKRSADLSPLILGLPPKTWRRDFYYEHPSMGKTTIPASQALVRADLKYILWPEFGYEEFMSTAPWNNPVT